jgi:ribonuclease BN (tRNA processing enzyme)
VTAAENTHFQLIPAEYRAQMKSYAYRFDTPHGAIVFTGDTGPSESVERLAKGADVLVSEVEDLSGAANVVAAGSSMRAAGSGSALAAHMQKEHLSMKDVGEMATEAQVRTVVLYHLIGQQPVEKIISGVKEYYSGPVFAGSDLGRYCLDTTATAGPTTLGPCP